MVIHVTLYCIYNNCAINSVAESSVSVEGIVGGGVGFVVLLVYSGGSGGGSDAEKEEELPKA